jgi:hypothetical protein
MQRSVQLAGVMVALLFALPTATQARDKDKQDEPKARSWWCAGSGEESPS